MFQHSVFLAACGKPNFISVPVKGFSFTCVGVDLVGPVPMSASGNRFSVKAVDHLTKWPESKAFPNKEAGTVLDFSWSMWWPDTDALMRC